MFSPTSEYTEEAAKKKIEGTVLVSLIVLPDGTSRNVTVTKGLGYGLDEQAVKAVSTSRLGAFSLPSGGAMAKPFPSRLRSKLPSTSTIRKIDATRFNEPR
jgi:TonB family protein